VFEVMRQQGLQANQDVTFLTDGGEEVRALTELVTPEAEHVLNWFHIAMRLTVLEQYARGVAHHDEKEGYASCASWHGNQCRARQHADNLLDDVKALEMDYPHPRARWHASAAVRAVVSRPGQRQPSQRRSGRGSVNAPHFLMVPLC